MDVLREITEKGKFVMLDPQGYLRKLEPSGTISLHRSVALDWSGISAVKADEALPNTTKPFLDFNN
ncbi:MAG: hypothetical protein WBP64_10185 [Nitrososphaeraceae archaeon]